MIYTDENRELRAIISDLNQQAIVYVERIATLEADKLTLQERDEKYCNTISGLQDHTAALEKVAPMLVEAMRLFKLYEMDVDMEPTVAHREFVRKSEDALRAAGYLGGGE